MTLDTGFLVSLIWRKYLAGRDSTDKFFPYLSTLSAILNRENLNGDTLMTDRLAAKVGTYTNKEGVEKGDYARLGVILTNDNGSYALLDPTINLSGVLQKQNAMAAKEGKPMRDMVLCSIFTDKQNQAAPAQQQSAPSAEFVPDQQIPF